MLDKLLNFIEKRGGFRMIVRDGQPYLGRYYVWRSKSLTILIHRFYASDPDDHHDHPWDWGSKILRGSYFERELDNTGRWRTPKDGWRWRHAEEFHRIEVDEMLPAGYTTSLFMTFGRKRKWGFLKKDGWVAARDYDQQPVDIEGRDFHVEGHLFPRVVWHREVT